MTIQWANEPRGASMNPTPCAWRGQVEGSQRVSIEGAHVAGLDVRHEAVVPLRHGVGEDLAFERAGGGAAHGREQRLERQIELRERLVGEFLVGS